MTLAPKSVGKCSPLCVRKARKQTYLVISTNDHLLYDWIFEYFYDKQWRSSQDTGHHVFLLHSSHFSCTLKCSLISLKFPMGVERCKDNNNNILIPPFLKFI